MTLDTALENRIRVSFDFLGRSPAVFPPPESLADALGALDANKGTGQHSVTPKTAALFTTGGVEAWHRAVHSFLISAALTEASPLWACVTGYYSSHYSMRAFAHLLGHFQMYRRKRVATISHVKGRYWCTITEKAGEKGEHRYYWLIVRRHPPFASDPLFTTNEESTAVSDASHRNRANYSDHLDGFPPHRTLNDTALRARIERISDIRIAAPPIPIRAHYPDLESVQIVAYHRLVRFRSLVDNLVPADNRFWRAHRSPPWTEALMDFQLPRDSSGGGIEAPA
jgi:hypothetical protein